MTLALLITAATGAWAQETLLTTINASSDFQSGSKTFDGVATVTITGDIEYDADYGWCAKYSSPGGSVSVEPAEGTTISSCKFYFNNNKTYTISTAPFVLYPTTYLSAFEIYTGPNSTGEMLNGSYGIKKIEVYCAAATSEPDVEVIINDTKTEASFKMPQYDVTATYTLKRDLSVETQVTVGDDHDAQPRYRVQKQGNTFQPVGMDQAQVMALFRVHDQIEDEDLAPVQDYTVEIYAVDIEGQPTGDAITFQNFTYAPGQYIVKAVGTGNYSGTTTQSNVFQLFQGYEVTVAPGDFATYYRTDDALYLEDTDAQLYTITAVSGQTATAEPISVAPAGTPVLVKNNSADPEKTTILLIPTTTDADVDFYAGFRGTLEATTIAASDAATDRYALNGQQFVWVKNPVSIAANKAWLEVPTGDNAARARAINIVFGDATGVSEVIEANGVTDDTWYDLNGRKVAVPNKKGIYIQNGKKVVVK